MDDRNAKGTPLAVVLSAILHLGIVAFLFLATLSCDSYESFLTALHLPNPITCAPPPLQLTGPVIEATLIGNTAAPPPKPIKVKPTPNTTPPPPANPPPAPPTPPVPKPDQLPPPPKNPDLTDQERVVQQGDQKADETKEQEEKERQHQADLDAKAAQKKQQLAEIDKTLAAMDQANTQVNKAEKLKQQAQQQMKDIQNAKDTGLPNLPNAAQTQTGNNSATSNLRSEYLAAIANTLQQNWQGPPDTPPTPCAVTIIQSVGGDIQNVQAEPSCPYNAASKKAVEDAAWRAHQLPYKGFEKVFAPRITVYFKTAG
jgi:colicin import membrane protein